MTTIHPRPIFPVRHQISRGTGADHVQVKTLPAKGLTRLTLRLRFIVSDKTPLLSGICWVLATRMPVSGETPPLTWPDRISRLPGQCGPGTKSRFTLPILSRTRPKTAPHHHQS